MYSLKRFFAMLFLCGQLVPSCYARPDGPPDSDATAPCMPAPAPAPEPAPAPASDSGSGPSDPGTGAN